MVDTIFKISCIIILSILTFVIVTLIISVLKDAYDYDKRLNHCTKKQAYREFANRLKDKSFTTWDYNEAVGVEEIDKTLLELIREIK